jgi:hypothetical protein
MRPAWPERRPAFYPAIIGNTPLRAGKNEEQSRLPRVSQLLKDFRDHLHPIAEAHEAAHRAVEYCERGGQRGAKRAERETSQALGEPSIEQRRPRAANDQQ